ncbi:MAG: glutaredoxin family protein [Gammaproteobacteria bacterium]|nr:glutaredoxin family protein [Gammaproteobacteria bacterium]
MPAQLSLYTRHGCHLCEDMEQTVSELAAELDFVTEIIPIDNNTGLEQVYGHRVPVLMIGDNVICEYFLDKTALIQAVTKAKN